MQRLERFLNRGLRIEPMNVIKIDVISPKPAQTAVDRFHDVLPGEPALIRSVAHGIKNFCGDDHFIAPRAEILQGAAEHFFARA